MKIRKPSKRVVIPLVVMLAAAIGFSVWLLSSRGWVRQGFSGSTDPYSFTVTQVVVKENDQGISIIGESPAGLTRNRGYFGQILDGSLYIGTYFDGSGEGEETAPYELDIDREMHYISRVYLKGGPDAVEKLVWSRETGPVLDE